MENIVLPKVNILSEINDSTNLMIEHNGKINRYPISDLNIGGGDVTIDLDGETVEGTIENINATTLNGFSDSDFVKHGDYFFADKLPKAGFIYPLASATVPEGFLLCDGAAYARTEYPELFAAIGALYGEGDGSTTFNVPNLQTRVPIGSGEGYELGSTGGEETHILTVDEMPRHFHDNILITGINLGWNGIYAAGSAYGVDTGGIHSLYTSYSGGSQPHNNMQPYTVVNYIIATGKNTGVSVANIIADAQALPLGIEYGGTGATNAKTARDNLEITPENIGAMSKMELLWENGSPSSAFVSQSINAELSGYEFYIVVFRESATIGFYHAQIVPKEKNTLLFTIDGNMATHVARVVSIRDGKIAFNAGFLGTAQNDSYVIPLEIYGIKGVSA